LEARGLATFPPFSILSTCSYSLKSSLSRLYAPNSVFSTSSRPLQRPPQPPPSNTSSDSPTRYTPSRLAEVTRDELRWAGEEPGRTALVSTALSRLRFQRHRPTGAIEGSWEDARSQAAEVDKQSRARWDSSTRFAAVRSGHGTCCALSRLFSLLPFLLFFFASVRPLRPSRSPARIHSFNSRLRLASFSAARSGLAFIKRLGRPPFPHPLSLFHSPLSSSVSQVTLPTSSATNKSSPSSLYRPHRRRFRRNCSPYCLTVLFPSFFDDEAAPSSHHRCYRLSTSRRSARWVSLLPTMRRRRRRERRKKSG
jgi:hypothetical protein